MNVSQQKVYIFPMQHDTDQPSTVYKILNSSPFRMVGLVRLHSYFCQRILCQAVDKKPIGMQTVWQYWKELLFSEQRLMSIGRVLFKLCPPYGRLSFHFCDLLYLMKPLAGQIIERHDVKGKVIPVHALKTHRGVGV